METGELRNLVIRSLRELKEASVNEVIDYITDAINREYAYTTIATILKRLEDDGLILSVKKKKEDRKRNYFRLQETAHKDEAASFLKDYINKFGEVGIRHLGTMMGSDISKDEIDDLRKRVMNSE